MDRSQNSFEFGHEGSPPPTRKRLRKHTPPETVLVSRAGFCGREDEDLPADWRPSTSDMCSCGTTCQMNFQFMMHINTCPVGRCFLDDSDIRGAEMQQHQIMSGDLLPDLHLQSGSQLSTMN
eukprot:TRINITY_DN738_c0_g1_i5.p2 TRINITY_DN738_c0_g1~~TRINITY_DN738_c0_g1_i5.p2  ORF type:complete len:122 (-),score=13.23 TRINITY_DN738_c0_g1_i5:320-685(-)